MHFGHMQVVPAQAQASLRMPELHLSLVLVALELVSMSWDRVRHIEGHVISCMGP